MSIEASYNDTAQHSLPILVNFVTNALMGLTDNWRPSKQPVLVSSFIEPLPRHEKPTMFYGSTYSAIFLVGFAYSMITAVFSADSVDEKEVRYTDV